MTRNCGKPTHASLRSVAVQLLLLCGSGMLQPLLHNEALAFSLSGSALAVGPTRRTKGVPSRKDLLALGTTPNAATTRVTHYYRHQSRSHRLVMRDRSSSYWFSVGDTVQVVQDVFFVRRRNTNHSTSTNLRGKIGRVVQTWEKCDVDPTCCCAEQVDTDMAVRVFFDQTETTSTTTTTTTTISDETTKKNSDENDNDNNCCGDAAPAPAADGDDPTSTAFYYYFAEEELVKV